MGGEDRILYDMKKIIMLCIVVLITITFIGCAQASTTSGALSGVSTQNPGVSNPDTETSNPPSVVTYTVTFNANDGIIESEKMTIAVAAGGVIENLPRPIREDYAFDKWYIDQSFTQEFTSTTVVTGNITVYANWYSGNLSDEYYVLEGDSYTVSGVATNLKGDVIISGMHNGKPVTAIDDKAFAGCSGITSVIIPDTVTSIGDDAFNWCINLKTIEIPESVTEIGKAAFRYCHDLESITIPNGVETIGAYAFATCYALKEVKLGENVKTIADYAFTRCYALESIVLPDSVESIGYRAFDECYALKNVVIGSGLKDLTLYAFYSCNALESFAVSADNTNYMSFDGVLYSKDGKSLYQYPAGKIATQFVFPAEVERVEYVAFRNAVNLERIYIPSKVTTIGENAFFGCTSVEVYTEIAEASKPYSSGYAYWHTGWHAKWNYVDSTGNLVPVYWESINP